MSDRSQSARIESLFEQAVDLPAERRTDFLREKCGDDTELHRALELRLKALDHVGKDTEFLEPAGANLADLPAQGINFRCPHCKNAIEILEDGPWDDICCENCGSHLNVLTSHDSGVERLLPKNLQHFHLLEKLGTGSFGSVWKAKDTELERLVAVKIPRKSQLGRHDEELFLREARVAARLRHTNIVSVHEIGRDETLYIVSDLIDGHPLGKWAESRQPNIRQIVEICIQIANGLQYAHAEGVIHRDLKPANILVDGQNVPHITDFGLAKREAAEITMTIDGQILGTPAYMSPEQAGGNARTADRRSDVYSLGVILFELLCQRLPFEGSSALLLQKVIDAEIPAPRKFNAKIPQDLETVCLKALAKEPALRYDSAADLADDLRRCLDFQPIRAKRVSPLKRLVKWTKRHRRAVWINALIGIAAACVTIVTIYAWRIYSENQIGVLTLTGTGIQTAIIRAGDGGEVKRVAVPTPEDVILRAGDYQLETVSGDGRSYVATLHIRKGQRSEVAVADPQPSAWAKIEFHGRTPVVIDRVGVVYAQADEMTLVGKDGVTLWTRKLSELLELTNESSRADRWQIETAKNIADVDGDQADDLLVRLANDYSRGNPLLIALSGADGQVIWRTDKALGRIESVERLAAEDRPARLVVVCRDLLAGIDLETGKVAWSLRHRSSRITPLGGLRIGVQLDPVYSQPVPGGYSASAAIAVIDADSGETQCSATVPNSWQTAGTIHVDGRPMWAGLSGGLDFELRSPDDLAVVRSAKLKQAPGPKRSIVDHVRPLVGPDIDGDGHPELLTCRVIVHLDRTDHKRWQQLRKERGKTIASQDATDELREIQKRGHRKFTLSTYSGADSALVTSRPIDIDAGNGPEDVFTMVGDDRIAIGSSYSARLYALDGKTIARLPRGIRPVYADTDDIIDFATVTKSGDAQNIHILSGAGFDRWRAVAKNVGIAGDLDGDGVRDVISFFREERLVDDEPGTRKDREEKELSTIETLSGSDGSRLWSVSSIQLALLRPVDDLDGDSCDDLLVGMTGSDTPAAHVETLVAYSGRTGKELWRSRVLTGESKMGNPQYALAGYGDPYSKGTDYVKVKRIRQNGEDRLLISARYGTFTKSDGRRMQAQWMWACLSPENGERIWKATNENPQHTTAPVDRRMRALAIDSQHHLNVSSFSRQGRDYVLGVDDQDKVTIFDVTNGRLEWEGELKNLIRRRRGASSRHGTPMPEKKIRSDGIVYSKEGDGQLMLLITESDEWYLLKSKDEPYATGRFEKPSSWGTVEEDNGVLRLNAAQNSELTRDWRFPASGDQLVGFVALSPVPMAVFSSGDQCIGRKFIPVR